MKGKLPVTQMIKLESDESKWMMLVRGLINELKTTALIEKDPGVEVRIRLVIDQIIPPEHMRGKNICRTETNLGENVAIGLSRSREFFSNFLDKTTWLFLGYIEGEEKAPILITYYQSIEITIYTQKVKGEEKKEFFPGLN